MALNNHAVVDWAQFSQHLPRIEYGDRINFADPATLAPAVVTVLIGSAKAAPAVLLTKRPRTLRKHTGQIALPGGRVDATDASVIAAGQRELHEEVGISADRYEILGTMPPLQTGTGYFVTPVIATCEDRPPLTLSAEEVARAFWMPAEQCLNPASYFQVPRRADLPFRWKFTEMRYEHERIWGLTATILNALAQRLYAESRA